jgi:hypothetical protein
VRRYDGGHASRVATEADGDLEQRQVGLGGVWRVPHPDVQETPRDAPFLRSQRWVGVGARRSIDRANSCLGQQVREHGPGKVGDRVEVLLCRRRPSETIAQRFDGLREHPLERGNVHLLAPPGLPHDRAVRAAKRRRFDDVEHLEELEEQAEPWVAPREVPVEERVDDVLDERLGDVCR